MSSDSSKPRKQTITLYAPGAWEFFHDCRDIEQNGKTLTFTADVFGQRLKQTIHGTWRIAEERD